jgi:hypothetical protein
LSLSLHHLAAEVIGREVSVAKGHLQVRVAQDLLQDLEASAPHHEPRSEVVEGVVDVEVV